MLTVNNLSLKTDQKIIIKDLSCSFFLNSVVILKGPNGIGKSLLLKTLAGLYQDYTGEILINNHSHNNQIHAYRNDINYISHEDSLKTNLSVIENMSFWARIYDNYILIAAAIRFFELEDLIDKKIKNLSKGQQKRVELTRLILKPTPIWLLDEPFVNLDQKIKKKLTDMIEVRSKEGGIIIIAHHDEELKIKHNRLNLIDFVANA